VAPSNPAVTWPGEASGGDSLRTFGVADYSWRLTSLDGEPLTLERFRGRTLFVNVWASWCAPCVAELDDIQKLYDSLRIGENADTSIAIVLITPDRPSAARRFLRRRGLTVPAYIEARRTPAAFALRALPTTYIVAPNGDIVLQHLGAAKWNTPEVRAFLRALAATTESGT
jgi:thiol-disulfide isomerase/thioredoxin